MYVFYNAAGTLAIPSPSAGTPKSSLFLNSKVISTPPNCYLHPSASIIQSTSTERGVYVQQSIPTDEIFLSVSMAEIITPQMGREQTPAGQAICKVSTKMDWHTSLALWLCHAKANMDELSETQKWYIETLPWTEMAHIPIFWSNDELSELMGSPLLEEIFQKRSQWETLYDTIIQLYQPFPQETTFEEFLQAKCLVGSRAFRLGSDDVDHVGMVPLADMLNHRSKFEPCTCDWSVKDNGNDAAFVIRTPSFGLKAGDEAFQSYGLYQNSLYLFKYGFCIEGGIDKDVLPMTVPIRINLTTMTLQDTEDESSELFHICIGDPEAAMDLLAFLRRSLATNNQSGDDQIYQDDKFTSPSFVDNEQVVMKLLIQSLESSIHRYPTSLDKDLDLLLITPKFTKLRNAVLVRSCEKKILHHWLDFCKLSLEQLDNIENNKESWGSYLGQLESSIFRHLI
jgi:hypothetical protein